MRHRIEIVIQAEVPDDGLAPDKFVFKMDGKGNELKSLLSICFAYKDEAFLNLMKKAIWGYENVPMLKDLSKELAHRWEERAKEQAI